MSEPIEAPKLDWMQPSIELRMDAARCAVAAARHNDVTELIASKIKQADNSGANYGLRRDLLLEARSLIAASIELALTKPPTQNEIKDAVLSIPLEMERLRATSAVDHTFRHQLQIETVCDHLSRAVVMLLALHLVNPASPATKEPDRG